MDKMGFFGENREINSDLNEFFDMYKKAVLVVFPNVKDIMFDKFSDMVDYQVKNLKKRIFWHWMKDIGLEMLKESNERITKISKYSLIDVGGIFTYQKMGLKTIFQEDDLYENVDVLINCIVGYAMATEICDESCKIYNLSQEPQKSRVDYNMILNQDESITKNGSAFYLISSHFTFISIVSRIDVILSSA